MRKIILSIIILGGFIWLVNIGIKRAEKIECIQWSDEAQVYSDYYLADWQEKQCQAIFKTSYSGADLLKRISARDQE